MSVSDFMTKKLIIVEPKTPIFDAVDLMKKHDIHRLPVLDNGRLVGLITEGIIAEAMPSKATTLSVYEANYLLNKTTVGDVMEKKVLTISPDALLEDAIFIMRKNNIGVLPVVADGEVQGIITNNDIFDAFLKITGYNDGGARITIQITEDHKGILADIAKLFSDNDYSIQTIVVNRMELYTIVEIHFESRSVEKLKQILVDAGYLVTDAVLTNIQG